MPVRVRTRVRGLRDAQRTIDGQIDRARTVMRNIAPQVFDFLSSGIANFFALQAGPDGPWPPLTLATIEAKGHDIILLETRRLRDSLTGISPDSIRLVADMALTFGTNRPDMAKHEEGILVPRRGFMPYGDQVDGFVAARAAENILDFPRDSLGFPFDEFGFPPTSQASP